MQGEKRDAVSATLTVSSDLWNKTPGVVLFITIQHCEYRDILQLATYDMILVQNRSIVQTRP